MTQYKLYAKDIGQFQKKTVRNAVKDLWCFYKSWVWAEKLIEYIPLQHLFSIRCSLSLVLAACVAIITLEWATAKLSSCTALAWRGTPVCSGWHPAQTQVNTFRDSVTAAGPPFKNVSVSLSTIHGSVPVHLDQTPPFQTKVYPFLHLMWHTLSFLFLHITNPCTSSMLRVIRAGEREKPDSPEERKPKCACETLLLSLRSNQCKGYLYRPSWATWCENPTALSCV